MSNPSRHESWKLFDRISSTYDRTNRVLSFGRDYSWRKKCAQYLPKKHNLKILDLATGTGDQVRAFLESTASIESITGIDLSKEMLEIAKEKIKRAKFLLCDAQKLHFKDKSFDVASFSFGIRNVPDPESSLKEIFRVLKPKGRVMVLEFSMPPQPIKAFYLFYLRYLLPTIGGVLSKDKSAYRYLNQTIEVFPSGKNFCALMKRAGFKRMQMHPMNMGTVTLYIGEKD